MKFKNAPNAVIKKVQQQARKSMKNHLHAFEIEQERASRQERATMEKLLADIDRLKKI